MKITIINGQNHKGSTYHIGKMLADKVGGDVTEFFLPKDFGAGAMATGMVQIDGASYYLDPASGAMAANTELMLGDSRYMAAADGSLSQITEEAQSGTEAQPQAVQLQDPAQGTQNQSGQSDAPVITPAGQSQPAPEGSHVSGINGGPGV